MTTGTSNPEAELRVANSRGLVLRFQRSRSDVAHLRQKQRSTDYWRETVVPTAYVTHHRSLYTYPCRHLCTIMLVTVAIRASIPCVNWQEDCVP